MYMEPDNREENEREMFREIMWTWKRDVLIRVSKLLGFYPNSKTDIEYYLKALIEYHCDGHEMASERLEQLEIYKIEMAALFDDDVLFTELFKKQSEEAIAEEMAHE